MSIINQTIKNTDNFINYINPALNKIVIFLLILVTGIIIAKLISKSIEKLLRKIEFGKFMRRQFDLKNSARHVSNFVFWIIGVASLLVALNNAGLTTTVFNILFAVIIITSSLFVLIGLKDFIPNFIAGLKIKQQGKLKEGLTIEVDGSKGKISSINSTEIVLKNSKSEEIVIPNSLLAKKKVKILKN